MVYIAAGQYVTLDPKGVVMAQQKTKVEKVPLRISMKDWETEGSLLLLTGWKREGYTDAQIAKKIGISPQSLCNWKAASPCILEALKKSREEWHKELEEAMYKRALGYHVKETSVNSSFPLWLQCKQI